MDSPRRISIQNRPMARQIQPTGFLGCLDAIRAPTMGKARKETKINSSLRLSPALVGSCEEWARTYSTTLARNMATQRPANVQASHAAVWRPILLTPRPCFPVSSVTTPLYRTPVSQALRQTLRAGVPRRKFYARTNYPREHGGEPEDVEVGTEVFSPVSVSVVNVPLKPSESYENSF